MSQTKMPESVLNSNYSAQIGCEGGKIHNYWSNPAFHGPVHKSLVVHPYSGHI